MITICKDNGMCIENLRKHYYFRPMIKVNKITFLKYTYIYMILSQFSVESFEFVGANFVY